MSIGPTTPALTLRPDGRSYLREASEDYTGCLSRKTLATYNSEGLLHRREHRLIADDVFLGGDSVIYFAGRPVAILEQGDALSSLTFLSTDHLGTPVLATNESGGVVWQGGFEPFGDDWNGAGAAGVFLRFPGQWEDASWAGGGLESGVLYYNVHRWYEPGTGRYTRSDPIGLEAGLNLYLYVDSRPLTLVDPTGLQATFVSPHDINDTRERSCAQGALARNYFDLREADWIGADGYFHCKGNCEASQCGAAGEEFACVLSDLRELSDRLFKGDPQAAIEADQKANQLGRRSGHANPNISCKILCASLRPRGYHPNID